MTQRSNAKDYTIADKLSVGSLELHTQSTRETAYLVFNCKLHLCCPTIVEARLSTLMVGTQQVWENVMTCRQ
jgi:hypothetical protein